jgi:hypothetical protein
MILDDVLKNRTLRKALAAGEEQVGKVMGRLLSSEAVTTGLQGLVRSALSARETFDRGVQQALRAAHLPSREDVAALRRKLEELEAMLVGLADRVGETKDDKRDPEE